MLESKKKYLFNKKKKHILRLKMTVFLLVCRLLLGFHGVAFFHYLIKNNFI